MNPVTAFVTAVIAGSASAQTELVVHIQRLGPTEGQIVAELLNPGGEIVATIANLGFIMDGSGFTNFSYNPAFDSMFFGDADISVDSTEISFVGTNTIPPLNNDNGPDSSNPLFIASFEATSVSLFYFLRQTDGAIDTGGPFADLLVYEDGFGGDTPYRVINDWIPAPASAAVMGFAGLAATGRRR